MYRADISGTASRRLTALVVTACFSVVTYLPSTLAVADSKAPSTEEDLKAVEKVIPPREGSEMVTWTRFVQRQPHAAYFDDFNFRYPGLKEQAEKQRQEALDKLDAADKARLAPETTDQKALSDASYASTVGMAMASSAPGGMVPGTGAHTVGNVMLGLAIGFEILNWLSKDRSDSQFRYEAVKSLNSASLYLFKFTVDNPDEDKVYEEIVTATKVIEGLGIGCEPAWYHSQAPATGGYTTPGRIRIRRFVCGFEPGEKLGFWDWSREPKDLMVAQIPMRSPLVMFKLDRLDDMPRMPAALGIPKDNMKNAGRLAFERIFPKLGPEWTVIFTAPGSDGKQHAYAARDGIAIEYPAVPEH